jgi:hypothetical protein
MAKQQSTNDLPKGQHIERDVIMLCARWRCRYKLSEQVYEQHAVKQQQMKEEKQIPQPNSERSIRG